jgi:hypothetical protein
MKNNSEFFDSVNQTYSVDLEHDTTIKNLNVTNSINLQPQRISSLASENVCESQFYMGIQMEKEVDEPEKEVKSKSSNKADQSQNNCRAEERLLEEDQEDQNGQAQHVDQANRHDVPGSNAMATGEKEGLTYREFKKDLNNEDNVILSDTLNLTENEAISIAIETINQKPSKAYYQINVDKANLDKQKGILEWTFNLKTKESKKINFSYKVQYNKDSNLPL